MKKYLYIVLFVGVCFGQTIAITSEGKIVNLNDDGTWSYKEEKSNNKSESIWTTKFFVDDFGDLTNQGYVKAVFEGTFSNSATTNSPLGISFIITEEVAIKLYEYNRNHSVSGKISTLDYTILIKHNGQRVKNFKAKNNSDRLVLDDVESKRMISLLNSGGNFGFKIIENGRNASSTYSFKIPDASGFNNEWDELFGKKIREDEEREKKRKEYIDSFSYDKYFSSDKFIIKAKQLELDGDMTMILEIENLTLNSFKSVWFMLNAKQLSNNEIFTERVIFAWLKSKSKVTIELYIGEKLKDLNFKFLRQAY